MNINRQFANFCSCYDPTAQLLWPSLCALTNMDQFDQYIDQFDESEEYSLKCKLIPMTTKNVMVTMTII